MYKILENIIESDTCNEVIKKIKSNHFVQEKRHFISDGKKFFTESKENLKILSQIVNQIFIKSNISEAYEYPFVDHAFLLLKSFGGNQTPAHQDRPFWLEKEDNPTMITCWIALEDIGIDKGALQVVSKKDANLKNFNDPSQKLYEHIEDAFGSPGNFSYILKEEDQKKCSMIPKVLNKGDAIFFDAYEPHSSSPNTSDSMRLAMKVVFRNGGGLFQVSKLIDNPDQFYPSGGKNFIKRVTSQLFRSKS